MDAWFLFNLLDVGNDELRHFDAFLTLFCSPKQTFLFNAPMYAPAFFTHDVSMSTE